VNNKYALYISVVLAIGIPEIIIFGKDLTKFWQKQVGSFLAHPVYTSSQFTYALATCG